MIMMRQGESDRTRASRIFLVALILIAQQMCGVRAFLKKEKRCAACVAMIDEIITKLEEETPQQNIAIGDQNHREFKPYATSELRVIEILEDACADMRAYYESEDAAKGKYSKEGFVRFDKFNLDRGALTGNQLHLLTKRAKSSHVTHNLQVTCESMLENMYDDISDALIEQKTDLYDRFCRAHARCKGRRRNECCSADQIEMHRAWKQRLDDIDRGLVGEYFDLAKGDEPGRDGYGKKAQKLYMDMLKREAIRKAAKVSDPSTTVAEIVKNEIAQQRKFVYRSKTEEEKEAERMEEKAEYERLKAENFAEKSEL